MELLIGRVTDYGVSGLWFNAWAGFLLREQKPVLYYEWSGTGETHALYHNVGEKKSPTVESSTWPLNSHIPSENYTKTRTKLLTLAVECMNIKQILNCFAKIALMSFVTRRIFINIFLTYIRVINLNKFWFIK